MQTKQKLIKIPFHIFDFIVQPHLQHPNDYIHKAIKKTVKSILSPNINQAFSIYQNYISILYLTLWRRLTGKQRNISFFKQMLQPGSGKRKTPFINDNNFRFNSRSHSIQILIISLFIFIISSKEILLITSYSTLS